MDRQGSTSERIIVCVTPSPFSIRLVRSTQRMARNLEAEWFAVYVETHFHARLPQEDQERVSQTLRLAGQLGARTVKLSGFSVSEEILNFARKNQVTKIIVGKPLRRGWREMFFGSVVDQLIRRCKDIDIYVISGEEEKSQAPGLRKVRTALHLSDYVRASVLVALCTLLVRILFPYLGPTNLIMFYFLALVVIAAYLGRGPSMFASCLSVAAFDFFFVPPYYTFVVANTEYVVTLVVMLVVSALISELTARVRHQAKTARLQERQTAALYEMGRNLTAPLCLDDLLVRAVDQIDKIFLSRAAILLPEKEEGLTVRAGGQIFEKNELELEVAHWVYQQDSIAGFNTEIFPEAKGLYLPLRASEKVIGVLRLEALHPGRIFDMESLRFLEALSSQVALAIERENLARQAHRAEVEMETEKLRNALLSSVSHDLRTPLTVIAGSASSLLEGEACLDKPTKRELTQTIYDESRRLDRLVHNILDMSRFESGEIKLHKEWHVLEDVIGSALAQFDPQLENHHIGIHLPADLPMVWMDALLIERVLSNLIDNALKHTPFQGAIEIYAKTAGSELMVEVADCGPGLPAGEEERIFEKFYQTGSSRGQGAGLGLAICRSIITSHGGRISAANRFGGGALFRFSLPLDGEPPIKEGVLSEIEKGYGE